MAKSILKNTFLNFTSDGVTVNAKMTATTNTLTFGGNTAADRIALQNVGSIALLGSTSGLFTQTASGTTTPYTVVWPSAQSSGTKALTNDGSGVMSWTSTGGNLVVAGNNDGDIQYKNGSALGAAILNSTFNYYDTIPGSAIFTVGPPNAGILNILPPSSTANGTDVIIQAGSAGTVGSGGQLDISSGVGGSTSGNSGLMTITTPDTTLGDSGLISISTGNPSSASTSGIISIFTPGHATNGSSGNINVRTENAGSGAGSSGSVTLEVGTAASGTPGFIYLKANTLQLGKTSVFSVIVGSDITFTNTLPNYIMRNTVGSGDIILRLTDSSSSSHVKFQNGSSVDIVSINGDSAVSTSKTTGAMVITGGLGVSDSIYSTTFNAISDINLKTDIKVITGALDKVLKIKGYEYNWKDTSLNRSNHTQIGFIAQQLEEIGLYNVVNGTDECKSVNYLAIIPLLVEALKEIFLLKKIP